MNLVYCALAARAHSTPIGFLPLSLWEGGQGGEGEGNAYGRRNRPYTPRRKQYYKLLTYWLQYMFRQPAF
jgi:hypothetical protein